jgi:hypothetical protein
MTSPQGFSLVELVIAVLITMAVAGVLFTFVGPAHRIFQAQPEQSDVQQRLRVSVDSLVRDLTMAGAGTYEGPAAGPLTYLVAPVRPYVAFGDAPDSSLGTFFRTDAVSFLYVPSTPSQTTLASPLAPGALDVQLSVAPNCPPPTATTLCGLRHGDRLMILDDASEGDVFSVDRVGPGVMSLSHRGPPAVAEYGAGAIATRIELGSYYLKTDEPNRTYQLMRHDGWATALPVVDDVVRLEFRYFGDPEPPRRTARPLEEPGPWTTYGPAPPLLHSTRGRWPAGENCAFTVVDGEHVPRLEVLGAGGATQVELTRPLLTDGPWCPDETAPNRFDADLLRVRRVRAIVRVQAALAWLRGPAGRLFLKAGRATGAERFVPDLEVQFDVAPRNMNLGR